MNKSLNKMNKTVDSSLQILFIVVLQICFLTVHSSKAVYDRLRARTLQPEDSLIL